MGGEEALLPAAKEAMFLEGPPQDLAWGLQTIMGYAELSGESSAACLRVAAGGGTASAPRCLLAAGLPGLGQSAGNPQAYTEPGPPNHTQGK